MDEIKYNQGMTLISSIVEKYNTKELLSEDILNSVMSAIDNRELKIAVIGKMNAGKSSLTNALIFHDNVLSTGAEPTTVTLTEIVYTDNPQKDSRAEVELLTMSDISDLNTNARSEDVQISKNAKELLDNLSKIPGGYEQYISKGTIEINLDQLTDFTSTQGRLNGLAKKVTIYKHLDYLRGIRIIDTPGFNDPVTSRGEATKSALKDCQIILFVHDYLDKYDQAEISILEDQVEYTGVSKLVDIINKMDMSGLSINHWDSFVPKFNRKKEEAIKQISKDDIKELLSDGTTSYVSALMALIGYEVLASEQNKDTGISHILSDETKILYSEYQDYFPELKVTDDFIKYSNIRNIVDIINNLSANNNKYLATYPIQTLIGHLKSLADKGSIKIKENQNALALVESDAEESRQLLNVTIDAFKAIKDKISSPELSNLLYERISNTKFAIQDARDRVAYEKFTPDFFEEKKHAICMTRAPQNRNLSFYQGLLTDFDNELRRLLAALLSEFKNIGESFYKTIVSDLTIKNITEEGRGNLSKNLCTLFISAINDNLSKRINVNQDVPNYYLDSNGKGNQYSLYRNDFLSRRKDSLIEEKYLKPFRDCVADVISSDILIGQMSEFVEKLRKKVKETNNYSPEEKEREANSLKEDIEELNATLEEIKIDIQTLEKFKQE